MKRIPKKLLYIAFFSCAVLLFLQFATGQGGSYYPFVAVGDTGCDCSGQKKVAQRMISWNQQNPYNAVLMLGDNIYGASYGFGASGGSKSLFRDRFDDYYNPLLEKGVKFYAAIGNHDAERRSGEEEIADRRRFNILGKEGYYTYTPEVQYEGKPLITFISINTVRLIGGQDPRQIAWISKTLTESKARWKVAYFHHPLYAPIGGHAPEYELRKGLENILVAAGVQVALAGHNHYYARMKPQKGIVHFVSGGGGRHLKSPTITELTASAAKQYHFMYFRVYPDRLEFQAIPPSGGPIDYGSILYPTPASVAKTTPPTSAQGSTR